MSALPFLYLHDVYCKRLFVGSKFRGSLQKVSSWGTKIRGLVRLSNAFCCKNNFRWYLNFVVEHIHENHEIRTPRNMSFTVYSKNMLIYPYDLFALSLRKEQTSE